MQEIQFYLVDAFSDKNFGGTAAAVCPLSEWLADDVLLKMAQQHNQSETAYFVRTDEGYELRWFTTLAEINLCGHATLAAAHVIFEYLDHPSATILFSTRFVGELRVTRNGKGSYDMIVPRFQKMAELRHQEGYYVRGTYTHYNTDFAKDILHIADLGFKQLAMEPVVADP